MPPKKVNRKPKLKHALLKFPKRPFAPHSLEPSATLQRLHNLTNGRKTKPEPSCTASPLDNRRRPLMDRLQQALLIAPAVVDQAIDEIIFLYGHHITQQHDGDSESAALK